MTEKLFSESQGRIVVSVAAGKTRTLEDAMRGVAIKRLGNVTQKRTLTVKDKKTVALSLKDLLKSYRSTFLGF